MNKTNKPCPGHRRLYWAELSRTWRWVCQRCPPRSELRCGCTAGRPPAAWSTHSVFTCCFTAKPIQLSQTETHLCCSGWRDASTASPPSATWNHQTQHRRSSTVFMMARLAHGCHWQNRKPIVPLIPPKACSSISDDTPENYLEIINKRSFKNVKSEAPTQTRRPWSAQKNICS